MRNSQLNKDKERLRKEFQKSGLTVPLEKFLSKTVIDCRPEPALYFDKAEPWQRDLDRLIGPAIERAIGVRKEYTGPNRFMIVMPRGHDKTSKLARISNYGLTFAKFPIKMAAGAVDASQAAILTDAMKREAQLNPWYGQLIEYQKTRVIGVNGELDILTSDAPSAYGRRDDITIIDELTHWKVRDLWDSLFSGAEKRPTGVFVIITNAGIKKTWQWDLYQEALRSPYWHVHSTPVGHRTGWMDAAQIEHTRSMISPGMASRVFDNVWIDSDTETIYLTDAEVNACSEFGKELGLKKQQRATEYGHYVISIDYAPKKDRTVLAVMHSTVAEAEDGKKFSRVIVDEMEVWQGSGERHVPIEELEQWIADRKARYRNPDIVVDPYQMESTIQKLSNYYTVFTFDARSGKRNYEMAENLRHLILNKRVLWYPNCGTIVKKNGEADTLEQELKDLVLKPNMGYGYRFDHENNKHDDRAVAIGMGCLYLSRLCNDAEWVEPEVLPRWKPTGHYDDVVKENRWSNHHTLFGVDYEAKSHPLFGVKPRLHSQPHGKSHNPFTRE